MGLLAAVSGHVAADREAANTSRAPEVLVLFTGVASTLSALRTAAQLAPGCAARVRLLLIETVPYPLPLDEPQRNLLLLGRQLRRLVDSSSLGGASCSLETTAEIVLCRDAWEGLRTKLRRNSVIVMGKRGGWWLRAENCLARRLRAAGYCVVRTSVFPPRFLDSLRHRGFTHA